MADAPRAPSERLAYVDNLRTVLVAWIIGGHALLGYSAVGGWAYDEVNEVTLAPGAERTLAIVLGPSGLFVIGSFFFLAGLFVPEAVARKGPIAFVRARAFRLGLPFLLSALLLWPVSVWIAYRSAGRKVSVWDVFTSRDPFLDSGSMWFALVLLMFSAAYAICAGFIRTKTVASWMVTRTRTQESITDLRARHLVSVAAGIAASTYGVRLLFPARSGQIADLHLWQWPQCAAMFGLGMAAARRGWARQIPDSLWRGSGVIAATTVVLIPVAAVSAGVNNLSDDVQPFLGGLGWRAAATASAEAVLVVSGSIWLLGFSQRHWTRRGRIATAWSRNSFAAFFLQGPILIVLSVALRPIALPAEIKATTVAVTGIVCCFWLGGKLTTNRKTSHHFWRPTTSTAGD